jgi:hypothetical protein
MEPPPQPDQGFLAFLLPFLGMVLAVLMVILVLAVVLLLIWWWWEWRGMGGLNPIVRAYARLERYITLIGIHLSSDQTPAERRQRIVRDLPAAEPPVTTITEMYTAQRYGPEANPHPVQAERRAEAVDNAWVDTRGSILKRWLARRLMPWRR